MLKALLAAALVLVSAVTAYAGQDGPGVLVKGSGVSFRTRKVAHLGPVNPKSVHDTLGEMLRTYDLPGPQVILIDSPGGDVATGTLMIETMEAMKLQGTVYVCIVADYAASMAFNILSHCDVRMATPRAVLMFHHNFAMPPAQGVRMTAAWLRARAAQLDHYEAPLIAANPRALHMSAADYEKYAEQQKRWAPAELIQRGYLEGVVKVYEGFGEPTE